MTLKAFMACFEVLFKLYDDLKADCELTICKKECDLIFFNALSADHCSKFVQQQKDYHSMTMDEIVSFFQVPQISLSASNVNERLLQKKNARKLTERGTLPTKNAPLLVETTLQALAMKTLKSVVS